MKKIFAINLGSTSTKVAYYEDERCVLNSTIRHTENELAGFSSVFEQTEWRKQVVLDYLWDHDIALGELDAFVSRGGSTAPIPGGVWQFNEKMVAQALSGDYGVHICSVGGRIALDIAGMEGVRALPLTVDPPVIDELQPLARYSGLPEIERKPRFQALNHRAMAKHYARSIKRPYEELNLIVVMLGGGITVVAHEKGKMIDGPDGLEGDGPFSNNRCCSVPTGELVKLCYSGAYTLDEMMFHINGDAGLKAYLGTVDLREIMCRIENGDAYAQEVVEAMCYQTAKEIGAYSTVLKGDVDAILLIGGMANVPFITEAIEDRVGFIAPVAVLPGEREMESLCLGALDALNGKAPIQQFE